MKRNDNRSQEELLKLVGNKEILREKDKVLVKNYNPVLKRYYVAVFTKDSYAKYQAYLDNKSIDTEMMDRIEREI